MSLKNVLLAVSLCLFVGGFCASPSPAYDGDFGSNGEAGLHPFLMHMGMPDEPGKVDLRVTGFQGNIGNVSDSGVGVHLEVGLWPRVGAHVRNDGLKSEGTELTLQFVLLEREKGAEGVCLVVENETAPPLDPASPSRFKTGLTAVKLILGNPLHLSFHYNSAQSMIEFESSLIMKANDRFNVVLEYASESDAVNSWARLLEALQVRITETAGFGIAFESPLTSDRVFDGRALLQADFRF